MPLEYYAMWKKFLSLCDNLNRNIWLLLVLHFLVHRVMFHKPFIDLKMFKSVSDCYLQILFYSQFNKLSDTIILLIHL